MTLCIIVIPQRKYRGVEQLVARRAHNLASLLQAFSLREVPKIKYRGVEQLVARRAHNPKVVGSSPASATKNRP